MKKKTLTTLHIVILFLIATLIVTAFYIKFNYSDSNIEQLLFYSNSSLESSDNNFFVLAVKICLPIVIILSVVIYAFFYDITFGKTKKNIYPFKRLHKNKWFYTITLLIISLCLPLQSIKAFDYIVKQNQNSTFLEDNYINPKDVNINFENKRNLIYISFESLETSLFTKEQGGIWKYEVVPELYNILNDQDTVVFNSNKAHGMNVIRGASYTSGSIVANNTTLPIKVNIDREGYSSNNFMSGSYSLGELLNENGYNNEVISGATLDFGGLDYFYKQHGNYNIIDPNTLKDNGYEMEETDKGKWGFNDKYLFELAKKRLEILSQENQPFNLNLLTIDTHFVDGYVGDYSETKYDRQYENAYATSSKLLYEFIEYVKSKPYYKDTTIVIVGDHLIMQSNFVNDEMNKNRYAYYCIINPVNKELKIEDRTYTALDTFPTVVYALGGNIEGDKIGLGVNLFSNKKTLAEKYSVKELDAELKKKSTYYNKKILEEGE